ncbi:MAG: acetyltransferase [Cyclobacteriaceae bacterium]|nr:acetyltransferase [Cyclobacteriaceae bacterium]
MKDIAIYGAGGFGRETAWLIHEIAQHDESWNLIGFFDDGLKPGVLVDGLPVLGGLKEVNQYGEPLELVIAIANPQIRSKCVKAITNHRIHFPVVIHPSVLRGAPDNVFGKGCILTAGVILTTGIVIGEFAIVNLATTLGHDVKLGNFSSIMPQCSISGNVTIGERTFIGAGARVLQGVTIEADTVVGAGAVVTKSFPAGSRLIGVPAQHVPPTA